MTQSLQFNPLPQIICKTQEDSKYFTTLISKKWTMSIEKYTLGKWITESPNPEKKKKITSGSNLDLGRKRNAEFCITVINQGNLMGKNSTN